MLYNGQFQLRYLLGSLGVTFGLISTFILCRCQRKPVVKVKTGEISVVIAIFSFAAIFLSGLARNQIGTYLFYLLMVASPLMDKKLTGRKWKEYGIHGENLVLNIVVGVGYGLSGLAGAFIGEPSWRATADFILFNSLFFIPGEELYFRGFIQTYSARFLGDRKANLLQSSLFALSFYAWGYNYRKTILVFIAGVVEGEIYSRTYSTLCTYLTQTTADIVPSILIYDILHVSTL